MDIIPVAKFAVWGNLEEEWLTYLQWKFCRGDYAASYVANLNFRDNEINLMLR